MASVLDYRIAGHFRGMAREPSEEIFAVVIFAFQCQETTPTTRLAGKYRCMGVSPSFNIRVDCSALEKRKNLHHAKISRYTVCVCTLYTVYMQSALRPQML